MHNFKEIKHNIRNFDVFATKYFIYKELQYFSLCLTFFKFVKLFFELPQFYYDRFTVFI